jgi:hypothetical protein
MVLGGSFGAFFAATHPETHRAAHAYLRKKRKILFAVFLIKPRVTMLISMRGTERPRSRPSLKGYISCIFLHLKNTTP